MWFRIRPCEIALEGQILGIRSMRIFFHSPDHTSPVAGPGSILIGHLGLMSDEWIVNRRLGVEIPLQGFCLIGKYIKNYSSNFFIEAFVISLFYPPPSSNIPKGQAGGNYIDSVSPQESFGQRPLIVSGCYVLRLFLTTALSLCEICATSERMIRQFVVVQ